MTEQLLKMRFIGQAHTPYDPDFTPHQPLRRDVEPGLFRIEIDPAYSDGLDRVADCSHIYVVGYFAWQEKAPLSARPPWLDGVEIGIFAARSPKRPSPLGLSIVKVLKVEGNTIYTSPLDFYDGTPILDIKPYLKTIDSRDDASDAWAESLEGKEHLLQHMLGVPHDHDDSESHHHHAHNDPHAHEHDHSHAHAHEHTHKDGVTHSHDHEHAHVHPHTHADVDAAQHAEHGEKAHKHKHDLLHAPDAPHKHEHEGK